jgi:hypothetical protein
MDDNGSATTALVVDEGTRAEPGVREFGVARGEARRAGVRARLVLTDVQGNAGTAAERRAAGETLATAKLLEPSAERLTGADSARGA